MYSGRTRPGQLGRQALCRSGLLHFEGSGRHHGGMGARITIHDVPDAVKDELAARAALQGKSTQELMRAELERLAARPSVEQLLVRIRDRKMKAKTRISSQEILAQCC